MRIEIWDKHTLFKLADGKPRTLEEIAREFPFILDPDMPVVLEYLPSGYVGGIDMLPVLRDMHGIDPALSDAEALQRYIDIRENPPEPAAAPMPEAVAALAEENIQLRAEVDYYKIMMGEE